MAQEKLSDRLRKVDQQIEPLKFRLQQLRRQAWAFDEKVTELHTRVLSSEAYEGWGEEPQRLFQALCDEAEPQGVALLKLLREPFGTPEGASYLTTGLVALMAAGVVQLTGQGAETRIVLVLDHEGQGHA
jgi:hypothetical protein